MLKSFRYLLFPITCFYALAVWFRNLLFDKKILKATAFNFPIIGVGNIATGGTGKTPMTELLITLLSPKFEVATLSRGYKRKTKGFAVASANTTALEIGDEPMQFHQKFPEVTVAVGEERIVAIPLILQERPQTEVIILDDAFQHRSIAPGLNILLTEHDNLYTRDFLLPVGDLRDSRKSSRRANIIIVTKCPADLSEDAASAIKKELKLKTGQQLFFTKLLYENPYHLFTKLPLSNLQSKQILLICGIANPYALMQYVNAKAPSYDMLRFADHHIFTTDDLKDIKKQFEKISDANKIMLTTEKDAVRLLKFEKEIAQMPIYVLPVKHVFLFDGLPAFQQEVISFIERFKDTASVTI